MKILSYNINGLNSFEKSGKLAELLETFPKEEYLYCLQEMRAQEPKIVEVMKGIAPLNEAHSINEVKKGYAGVSSLSWNNINITSYVKDFDLGLEDKQKYIYGRVIVSVYEDLTIINVYVPNSGAGKEELRQLWDIKFREFIKNLDYKYLVIVGDFNVCTTELDYWGDYDEAKNSMPGLMDFEIEGFKKLCDECELIDTFRYFYPEKRSYSWYNTKSSDIEENHGWRIDYALVSKNLIDKVQNINIHQGFQAPDHSPITIDIKI